MDEDQQFFETLNSLRQSELIDLIADQSSQENELVRKTLDAEKFDLDKLGEQVGRMVDIRRGAIIQKGMVFMHASLWRRVKHEMNHLICTKDKKYASLRKKLSIESTATSTTIVGMIAATVGAEIGMVAWLIVPLVALTLAAVLRISKEAYCADI